MSKTGTLKFCGVWAVLERTIKGVSNHESKKYLKRYLSEVCYRLNEGDDNIFVKDRVGVLCTLCAGVRRGKE